MHRKGFTLLELLIVIAILAVLATVAVLVINPLEYIKQSRDAKRIGDMEALNKALSLVEFENISLGGASTTVFVSLLDTASSTCGTLGLPQLPTGYLYKCVTTAVNLNKVDGTGWIPVNFTSLTAKSPLATLPVDPTNDVTKFYTYIPGGSFALSATLESDKYLKQSALADGGTNPIKIETGSDIKLLTKADGLAGYWNFDEGSGTVVYDKSSNGKNGAWNGTGAHYTAGRMGQAGQFNGSDDYVALPTDVVPVTQIRDKGVTYSAWIKTTNAGMQKIVGQKLSSGYSDFCAGGIQIDASNKVSMIAYDNAVSYKYANSNTTIQTGAWYFVTGVYDYINKTIQIYVSGQAEGAPVSIGTFCVIGANTTNTIGNQIWTLTNSFSGAIDDVRIYNRTLSASEIKAMYDATK